MSLLWLSAAVILGSTGGNAQASSSVQNHAVTVGGRVVLAASAEGSNPFTYQWRKDGAEIAGEVGHSLVLRNVQPADAGVYSIVVSNSAGSAVSAEVMLVVNLPEKPEFIQQAHSQVVGAGHVAVFQAFVSGTFPVTYQWRRNGVSIGAETNAMLILRDVQASDAGEYSVEVTNAAGSVLSEPAALEVVPPAMGLVPASMISNFAARATLAAGQTLAVGISIPDGSGQLLVRAAGPALRAFGVSDAMTDPRIDLYRADALLLSNDNWPPELAKEFAMVGAFGFREGSKDAALLQRVTDEAIVQVGGTGAGTVLVDAYTLGTVNAPGFRNFSVQHRVRSADESLVIGFNIAGSLAKQLLIRAVGPGLAAFGFPRALANPKLEIYNSAGARILENDHWNPELTAAFASAGAFDLPEDSGDAAVLVALAPGGYTALINSADGASGEAMLEVYEVP